MNYQNLHGAIPIITFFVAMINMLILFCYLEKKKKSPKKQIIYIGTTSAAIILIGILIQTFHISPKIDAYYESIEEKAATGYNIYVNGIQTEIENIDIKKYQNIEINENAKKIIITVGA